MVPGVAVVGEAQAHTGRRLTIIGGVFNLELFLPDDYPMTPPKIRFLTKIYHPNIDKLGRICLDVLKSESPTTTLLLRALLT